MPAPWRRNRRARYSARAHDVETRLSSPVITVVPVEVAWKARPGEVIAHAFSSGPGWMRSVCRAERWTAALVDMPDGPGQCDDCSLLVDGAPGEIVEAYGS